MAIISLKIGTAYYRSSHLILHLFAQVFNVISKPHPRSIAHLSLTPNELYHNLLPRIPVLPVSISVRTDIPTIPTIPIYPSIQPSLFSPLLSYPRPQHPTSSPYPSLNRLFPSHLIPSIIFNLAVKPQPNPNSNSILFPSSKQCMLITQSQLHPFPLRTKFASNVDQFQQYPTCSLLISLISSTSLLLNVTPMQAIIQLQPPPQRHNWLLHPRQTLPSLPAPRSPLHHPHPHLPLQ